MAPSQERFSHNGSELRQPPDCDFFGRYMWADMSHASPPAEGPALQSRAESKLGQSGDSDTKQGPDLNRRNETKAVSSSFRSQSGGPNTQQRGVQSRGQPPLWVPDQKCTEISSLTWDSMLRGSQTPSSENLEMARLESLYNSLYSSGFFVPDTIVGTSGKLSLQTVFTWGEGQLLCFLPLLTSYWF